MADIPPPPPPPADAPPPPSMTPPPSYSGSPGYPPMPPGSPGYMPQPIGPTSGSGLNIGAQIVGARSSIIVGVIGIIVPIVSAFIFSGSVFYFYVLPIFGIIYGVRSIGRGFVIGGGIGIALNVVAGLVSLTAAGIINPG